ncbi:UNVERIFIED_CONTAM: hypothetical protein Sradi_7241100 [Sesamum radiatum]|uniref:Uncharacterized protein n=1 Tax=Sesamum radiatum TaxID=300843 RepID=A0AAW2IMA4_SESRA
MSDQLWKIKGNERWKLWSEGLRKQKLSFRHKTEEQEKAAEDKERVASNIESSSPDSAVKKSFSGAPTRKGNFSFSGHTSKQDVEVSDRKLAVDRVLHELFQHGDSAQKYMQGSKSMKIENTILLDNYVQRNGMSSGGLPGTKEWIKTL